MSVCSVHVVPYHFLASSSQKYQTISFNREANKKQEQTSTICVYSRPITHHIMYCRPQGFYLTLHIKQHHAMAKSFNSTDWRLNWVDEVAHQKHMEV